MLCSIETFSNCQEVRQNISSGSSVGRYIVAVIDVTPPPAVQVSQQALPLRQNSHEKVACWATLEVAHEARNACFLLFALLQTTPKNKKDSQRRTNTREGAKAPSPKQ